MEIEWKARTVTGELATGRLARLLARLIIEAEDKLTDEVLPGGCDGPRCGGRNEEIPSTQEVTS